MYSEDDFFYDSVLDIPFSTRMSVVQIGILEVSERLEAKIPVMIKHILMG